MNVVNLKQQAIILRAIILLSEENLYYIIVSHYMVEPYYQQRLTSVLRLYFDRRYHAVSPKYDTTIYNQFECLS